MGFIDDDSESPLPMLVVDLIEDEGKLLHGSDDDLLPVLQKMFQVA